MIAWPRLTSRERSPSTKLGRLDRFWLPVTDRPVLHFFNRNLYLPHRMRERLAVSARRWTSFDRGFLPKSPDQTATLSSPRLRARPYGSAAHSRHGEVGSAQSDHHLLRRVDEIVRTFLAGRDDFLTLGDTSRRDSGQRWILIEDGAGTDRLLILLFPADHDRPTVALKIAPDGGDRLAREHDSLVLLHATLSTDLAACLPRPGSLWRQGESQILPLSILEGRPAYVDMQATWQPRRHVAHHLRRAVEWLVQFHFETHSDQMFLARAADHDALMAWAGRLEAAGVERVSWFESLWLRCHRSPIPLTAGHGDFWARNLLLSAPDGSTTRTPLPGVVDWELFQPIEAPFVDLFHFAVTYGLNYLWSRYRRVEPLEALRGTFLDDNPLSREIHSYLDTYCQRVGIDPDLLDDLFRLYLLGLADQGAPKALRWTVRSHLDPDTWLDFHRLVRHSAGLQVAA